MQSIEAGKLFSSSNYLEGFLSEDSSEILIDFKNVSNIELDDITTLLNIQKLAVLNKKRIKIENVKPDVQQILEITGLYKTFANMMSNPILISKRLSIAKWK